MNDLKLLHESSSEGFNYETYSRRQHEKFSFTFLLSLIPKKNLWPIVVAALFKAWTDFACSNAGNVGWDSTQGMDVCVYVYCVCVVLCV
jgi:hypothetical protein